jgi:hypothetical protein
MENAVFWNVTPWALITTDVFLRCVIELLVTDNVVPNTPILVTLMVMEVICSAETSDRKRATQTITVLH